MNKIAVLLLLVLGCAAPAAVNAPQTSEEWAVLCMRLADDPDPERRALFDECLQHWKAWSAAQKETP